jgi:hypothetical protein
MGMVTFDMVMVVALTMMIMMMLKVTRRKLAGDGGVYLVRGSS